MGGKESNQNYQVILTLFIIATPKCVLWQTVKTQMKCRIMRHFIRVCTVCEEKIDLQNRYNIFLEIIPGDPFIYTTDHPKLNQRQ